MSEENLIGEQVSQNTPFTIEVAERVRRLPPYLFAQINKLMYDKRRAGDDVIDMGMGNPSDPPHESVIEKLAEAARDPKNHGYAPAQGIMSLRREVAAKYFKQYGVRLDPEREAHRLPRFERGVQPHLFGAWSGRAIRPSCPRLPIPPIFMPWRWRRPMRFCWK